MSLATPHHTTPQAGRQAGSLHPLRAFLMIRYVAGAGAGHLQGHALSHAREASRQDWTQALRKGVQAVQYYGGAQKGMRTILDAFLPALEVLLQGKIHTLSLTHTLSLVVVACAPPHSSACWRRRRYYSSCCCCCYARCRGYKANAQLGWEIQLCAVREHGRHTGSGSDGSGVYTSSH